MKKIVLLSLLGGVACGNSDMPPPAMVDAGPLPCVLSADVTRVTLALDESKPIVLTASMGDCSIERIRLDRRVFQIVDEPMVDDVGQLTTPWVIEGGSTQTVMVQHVPTEMLMDGVPIRDLVFTTADTQMVTVVLEGERPNLGCLTPAPDEVLFTGVGAGDTAMETITLTNGCPAALDVTDVELREGSPIFSVTGQNYPLTLQPNDTLNLTVAFSPTRAGGVAGLIRVTTNDPQNERIEIRVVGFAQGARMVAFPRILDLGAVAFRAGLPMERSECGSDVGTLTLANGGIRDLLIEGFDIPVGLVFELTSVELFGNPIPIDQSFTIPVGMSAQVNFRMFPERFGPAEHESEMFVRHNAGPRTRFIVQGRGAADTPALEIFRAPVAPKVDVLLVVDGLDVLDFAQSGLLGFSSGLLDQLAALGVDYRVTATTTNVEAGSPGRFLECPGMPNILRSDEGTLVMRQETLRCMLQFPFRSASSAGLEAAAESISRSLNPEMFRPDAAIHVLIISSRDDAGFVPNDALDAFYETLKLRSRPDGATIHAIAGPSSAGCAEAEPGTAYQAATQRTGGSFFSICEADWSPFLTQMTAGMDTPNAAFKLDGQPDAQFLTVRVGGQQLSQGANGYRYDAATNTVHIERGAPMAGETVEVAYPRACNP